jgi:hypothetical protein
MHPGERVFMSKHFSVVTWVLAAAVSGGCAIPRGQLPSAPSYYDLINDGRPQRQEELKQKYEVRSEGNAVYVGDALRTRGRVDGPLPTEWNALHPDVQGYLTTDKEAAAALPSSWVLMPSGAALVVGALATLAVPMFAVAAGVAATAFLLGGKPTLAGPWNLVDRSQLPAAGAGLSLGLGAVGMLVSAVVAGPLMAVGAGGLWFVNKKVEEAQAIFNRNLARRIAEATTAAPPAGSAGAPTPVPAP